MPPSERPSPSKSLARRPIERLSLIWAQDEQGVIGGKGRLPWRLPADMAWFKRHTMGKAVLMGRKTFESIGRPLSGRVNLVLTRHRLVVPGCKVVHSLHEALVTAEGLEIMVIGGAQVYALTLPIASRLYVTRIHAHFEGDTYFPPYDTSLWREVFRESHPADERNPYPYSFHIYTR